MYNIKYRSDHSPIFTEKKCAKCASVLVLLCIMCIYLCWVLFAGVAVKYIPPVVVACINM